MENRQVASANGPPSDFGVVFVVSGVDDELGQPARSTARQSRFMGRSYHRARFQLPGSAPVGAVRGQDVDFSAMRPELIDPAAPTVAGHATITDARLASPLSGDPGEHALEPGQLLAGRYRITGFVARGGMGEV